MAAFWRCKNYGLIRFTAVSFLFFWCFRVRRGFYADTAACKARPRAREDAELQKPPLKIFMRLRGRRALHSFLPLFFNVCASVCSADICGRPLRAEKKKKRGRVVALA